MNAAQLLAHFDQLAEAPNAVPRLRRFILDLAVRGKLVAQDAGDEPASTLLKQIESEIARLVKIGEMRKPKALPSIETEEEPFDAPTGWRWVRIRQVTSDRGQTTPAGEFTYIDVGSINKEAGVLGEHKVLSASDAPSRARKVVGKGDVLYSCVRPTLLNIAVVEDEIKPTPIASTAFAVLNSFGLVLPRYIWIALRSPYLEAIVESGMRGQAYPAINDAEFALLPLALPPLTEQHRIVAKVDEIMALCDQLEAAQQERERRRGHLAAASLQRLNQPAADTSPEAQREHARFHLHHLPSLTTRPEHIKAMRKTLLNLAIRGSFTRTGGSTTSECSESVRKTPKPYQISACWRWVRMDEVVKFNGGSQPPKGTFIFQWREGYTRLVQIRDFKSDGHMTYVPNEKATRPFEENDVMIGRYGPPVFQILRGLSGTHNVALMKAVPLTQDLSNDFLFYLLQESRIHETVVRESERTAGQTGIRLPLLNSFVVGLPPLAEQHRIVAKVDALMALCDQLESQLTTTQTDSRRLLEAVLEEALAPA
jgi:type I restriction enzyme S subunit